MATSRQVVFAITPRPAYQANKERPQLACTFSWMAVADLNSDSKLITCGYIPPSRGTNVNVFQEQMFLGTLNASLTMRTFRSDRSQDNGSNFDAEAITVRLDPTLQVNEVSDTKRFNKIEFLGVNTFSDDVTVQFAKDTLDPERNVTWNDIDWVSPRTRAGLPTCIARWIHLRILDQTNRTGEIVFGSFNLHYYDLFSREGSVN